MLAHPPPKACFPFFVFLFLLAHAVLFSHSSVLRPQPPTRYFIDYLASMQQIKKGCHGYAAFFCNSLLDFHWKPDMTIDEGLALMQLCAAEMKRRFAINMPNWIVKVVDKDGTRTLQMPPI